MTKAFKTLQDLLTFEKKPKPVNTRRLPNCPFQIFGPICRILWFLIQILLEFWMNILVLVLKVPD